MTVTAVRDTVRARPSRREVSDGKSTWSASVGRLVVWRWRVATIGVVVLAASVLLGGGASAHDLQRQSHWIAFARYVPALDDDATYLVDLDTGKVRRLFPGASNSPHWSPDGRLVALLGCADPPACNTAAILVNPETGHSRAIPMPEPDRIFTACNLWTRDGRRLTCEGEGLDDSSLTASTRSASQAPSCGRSPGTLMAVSTPRLTIRLTERACCSLAKTLAAPRAPTARCSSRT